MPVLTLDMARSAPGAMDFAQLSAGFTHYQRVGPAHGNPVVLVHGLTTPCFAWDSTVGALVDAGHRVLRFDLYGRGLSERPHIQGGLADYVRQLKEISADWPCFDLVAWSWGCGVAAAFAVEFPEKVKRIVLLAPGGLGEGYQSTFRLLKIPLLGELFAATLGSVGLLRDVDKCFVQPEKFAWYKRRFREQLAWDGYDRLFLATMRHCPARLAPTYAALAEHSFPVDVLWGTADQKVPWTLQEEFVRLVPRAELHPIEGAGHAAQVEHPAKFNHVLLSLLGQESRLSLPIGP